MKKQVKKSGTQQSGFTLIELLIAIALLAITAGLTGDIILSLVRSYNKTRITNEIEQSGNIAISKIEKEIRVGTELITPALSTCGTTLSFRKERVSDGRVILVTYEVLANGSLRRREDDGSSVTTALVLDSTQASGVILEPTNSRFCVLNQTNPNVVLMSFDLRQASSTGGVSFQGNVILEQTIVLRGTY